MEKKIKIVKAYGRFVRQEDKYAIERVNKATSVAHLTTKVERTRVEKINAIRKTIGLKAA